jgi:hypothetical protein
LVKFGLNINYIKSVKWGGFLLALSFLKQILLVPISIKYVGTEGLASWIIIGTFISVITSTSQGHLFYCSNLISITYYRGDDFNTIIARANRSFLIYAAIQVILGGVLTIPLFFSFLSGFSINHTKLYFLQIAFIIMLPSKIFLQYCMSFLARLFEPVGKISTTYKLQVFGELSTLFATLLGFFVFQNIIYTSVLVSAINIIYGGAIFLFVKNKVPFAISGFLSTAGAEPPLIKKTAILNFSFFIERLYDMGLNLFVTNFFSVAVLPLFTTMKTISNSLYRFITILLYPLYPEIQRYFSFSDKSFLNNLMDRYWNILLPFFVFFITIITPFLPAIYRLWTKNEMEFNMSFMLFLFISVCFQNFGFVITEYLKRTNDSVPMMIFNIIKSSSAIICIIIFGYFKLVYGLGIAIAVAELLGLAYLYNFVSEFKNHKNTKPYLIRLLIFCFAIIIYLLTGKYILFATINTILLVLITMPYKKIK